MPASEAQVLANRANAAKSTGPKTEEGKLASRANAMKHGLTAKVVLPEREAALVADRYQDFCKELNPSGVVGYSLVNLAAVLALRVERCAIYESASMTEHARRAEAEFVAPEGASDAEIAKLRSHAAELALFDASQEATLARKYQAAAERGFLRVLKELRDHEKAMKAAEERSFDQFESEILGSNFSEDDLDAELAAIVRKVDSPAPKKRVDPAELLARATRRGRADVPMTIGKPG